VVILRTGIERVLPKRYPIVDCDTTCLYDQYVGRGVEVQAEGDRRQRVQRVVGYQELLRLELHS